MSAAEIRELREARWRAALEEALARQGRQAHELALAAKGAPWKLELARDLRVNAAVPHAWIAAQLRMGTPSSLRANLSRRAIRIAVEGEWPRSAVGRVDHPVGSTISGLTPSIRDLGFVIDKADAVLGTVSGTKLAGYEVRMTVSVLPRGPGQVLVRANAQFNGIKAIEDPKPYQDFFAALEKSLFLTEQAPP
jgi:hypothetical protein